MVWSYNLIAATAVATAMQCLCGAAVAFEFKADTFDAVYLNSMRQLGIPTGTRARPLVCYPETRSEDGKCIYSVSSSVHIGVSNAHGLDTPTLVGVLSDGDKFGERSMRDAIKIVVNALTPEASPELEGSIASSVTEAFQGQQVEVVDRSWTVGEVEYRFRPNPQLGSRDGLLFTALDTRR